MLKLIIFEIILTILIIVFQCLVNKDTSAYSYLKLTLHPNMSNIFHVCKEFRKNPHGKILYEILAFKIEIDVKDDFYIDDIIRLYNMGFDFKNTPPSNYDNILDVYGNLSNIEYVIEKITDSRHHMFMLLYENPYTEKFMKYYVTNDKNDAINNVRLYETWVKSKSIN